jgi:hypothetical protein
MRARANLLHSLKRNLNETRDPELRARLLAAIAALRAAKRKKFKRRAA